MVSKKSGLGLDEIGGLSLGLVTIYKILKKDKEKKQKNEQYWAKVGRETGQNCKRDESLGLKKFSFLYAITGVKTKKIPFDLEMTPALPPYHTFAFIFESVIAVSYSCSNGMKTKLIIVYAVFRRNL